MNALIRAALLTGTIAIFAGTTISAVWSQSKTPSLFKVVTEKDEIIIGLNAQELQAIGGSEKNAGAVARALADKKELTVWQYSVRKSPERRFAGHAAPPGWASREPIAQESSPIPVLYPFFHTTNLLLDSDQFSRACCKRMQIRSTKLWTMTIGLVPLMQAQCLLLTITLN